MCFQQTGQFGPALGAEEVTHAAVEDGRLLRHSVALKVSTKVIHRYHLCLTTTRQDHLIILENSVQGSIGGSHLEKKRNFVTNEIVGKGKSGG